MIWEQGSEEGDEKERLAAMSEKGCVVILTGKGEVSFADGGSAAGNPNRRSSVEAQLQNTVLLHCLGIDDTVAFCAAFGSACIMYCHGRICDGVLCKLATICDD